MEVEQEYLHRAKPVDLRKAIETANAMLKAGLMFVVIPVISNADYAVLSEERDRRLEMLIKAVEE